MPFTFNGIGTKFYGQREQADDGSYITTEWVTFFYLPLVPIRSEVDAYMTKFKHMMLKSFDL